MIEVKNLYHDYEGKGKYAVKDISFLIENGSIFGLLGPSGAGKSTIQNIMTSLLPIQQGNITYDGCSIRKIKKDFFNYIGYSFEHPNLHGKLTGYESLKYFAGLFAVETEEPMELLERVGLKNAALKKVGQYSKGMKQRLVFARSIINKPKYLFLDEPLAGLDPSTAAKIKEIILDIKKKGTTILLTTHNMYVAEELCDMVAFLNEGQIVVMDTTRNLKLRYGRNSVKVEYIDEGTSKTGVLYLDNKKDKQALIEIVNTKEVQTLHSQEATLNQIFIRLTGRELV